MREAPLARSRDRTTASVENMPDVVDAHLQVWNPDAVHYPWMTAENTAVHREFRVPDIEDQLADEGVASVILVQAADNRADSERMLFQALSSPRVAGVVAWIPLDVPDESAAQLDLWRREPVVGIGHRGHDARDPDWLLDRAVDDTLTLLTERRLTLDLTPHTPTSLAHVATLAENHPKLTIVLDHLGDPPLAALRAGDRDGWGRWSARCSARSRELPNVAAKVSGLSTAAGPGWVWTTCVPPSTGRSRCSGPTGSCSAATGPMPCSAATPTRRWRRSALDGRPAGRRRTAPRCSGGTAAPVYGLPFSPI